MAKIVFNFFEANMDDDEVSPFLKKIEEVLKNFAGEAYHFRYYLEGPLNMAQSKTEKDGSTNHNGSGFSTRRV